MGDPFFEDVVIDGDAELFPKDPGKIIFVDKGKRLIFCFFLGSKQSMSFHLNSTTIFKTNTVHTCAHSYNSTLTHYSIIFYNIGFIALRFYLTHKAEMKDTVISEFWEFELMMDTCSFNQPERFEEERFSFVEQGLLSINEYHRTSLIAYMCNLNSQKAGEHFSKDNRKCLKTWRSDHSPQS